MLPHGTLQLDVAISVYPQSNTDPIMIMTFSPAVHSKTCHISFTYVGALINLGAQYRSVCFECTVNINVEVTVHTVCLKHKHDNKNVQKSLYSMVVAKHEQTFMS